MEILSSRRLARDLERDGERRGGVADEACTVGVHALELAAAYRGTPASWCGQPPAIGARGKGQAQAWLRGTRRGAGVDDDELAVVDEPERSSCRHQEVGHVHERLRHLRRCRRGGEGTRELLDVLRRRRLLGLRRARRLLVAKPLEGPRDPNEHEGDDELTAQRLATVVSSIASDQRGSS